MALTAELPNTRTLTLQINGGVVQPVVGVGPQGPPGPGSAAWTALEAVTAATVRQAPDGSYIRATTSRITRATFDPTEQGFWAPVLATAGTLENTALLASIAAMALLTNVAVSADGALARQKLTKVDASGGIRAMTIPDGTQVGEPLAVEKVDATANLVNVTGKIRSTGSTTFPLTYQYETMLFVWGGTFWEPLAGHRTKTSIDIQIDARVPAADTTTQGKVELATTIETKTGTDTTRVVTPKGAADTYSTLPKTGKHPLTGMFHAEGYGLVGDGVTANDTAGAALLADAVGGTAYFGPGTFLFTGSTRLVLAGLQSTIQGNPSGIGSVLKFTHASGGLDIGDGTNNTYENRLLFIGIQGGNVTTTLVRARKMYEPYFFQTRIEQADPTTGVLLDMNECGQLDSDRPVLANAAIGMRISGTVSPITVLRLVNFYNLNEVLRVAGPALSKFTMEGWVEACDSILTLNNPGGAISIGEFQARLRVLKINGNVGRDGNVRLVKAVAATNVNAVAVDFDKTYVSATTSNVPLVDFTALDNSSATFKFRMRDATVAIAASTVLVQTNASQTFNTFLVDFGNAISNGGSGVVTCDLWVGNPFATGGSWPTPPTLYGSGTPEAAVTAFKGSIYKRIDAALGANPGVYVKAGGNGNTGWRAHHSTAIITTKTANYSAATTDDVIVMNGTSLTCTLPSAGNVGCRITVKNINASAATVQISGGTTIDGAATVSLAQWAKATFVSNGTNWFTI